MPTPLPAKRDYTIKQGATWSDSFTLYKQVVPTTWLAASSYALGAVIVPTHANNPPLYYRAIVAGTTGTLQPGFPLVAGKTIVDGGVTWLCQTMPITPKDLTNAIGLWQGRSSSDAQRTIFSKTTGPGGGITFGGTAGTITLALTPADTGEFALASFEHDFRITYPDTTVQYPFEGIITTAFAVAR
jgi:hypothetical protein